MLHVDRIHEINVVEERRRPERSGPCSRRTQLSSKKEYKNEFSSNVCICICIVEASVKEYTIFI